MKAKTPQLHRFNEKQVIDNAPKIFSTSTRQPKTITKKIPFLKVKVDKTITSIEKMSEYMAKAIFPYNETSSFILTKDDKNKLVGWETNITSLNNFLSQIQKNKSDYLEELNQINNTIKTGSILENESLILRKNFLKSEIEVFKKKIKRFEAQKSESYFQINQLISIEEYINSLIKLITSFAKTNNLCTEDVLNHLTLTQIYIEKYLAIIEQNTLPQKDILEIITISFMLAQINLFDRLVPTKEFSILLGQPSSNLKGKLFEFCETVQYDLNPPVEEFLKFQISIASKANNRILKEKIPDKYQNNPSILFNNSKPTKEITRPQLVEIREIPTDPSTCRLV